MTTTLPVGPRATSRRERFVLAVLAGVAFFLLTLLWLLANDPRRGAGDFQYALIAARALIDGREPYAAVLAESPFRSPFFYPLPAAVVALPFTILPPAYSGAALVGVGFAWLAYRLSASGKSRLLVLTAAPALFAVLAVQWSPLITAAALSGPALGLVIIKPTIGLSLVAMAIPAAKRPGRLLAQTTAVATVLIGVALLLRPDWPAHWLAGVRSSPVAGQFRAPILTAYGFPAILAVLRWRRPEARLLLVLSSVRQNGFLYDQLPLLLIPRSPAEALVLSGISHVSHIVALWHPPADAAVLALSAQQFPFTVIAMYIPCLIMVLRRPNEGSMPLWVERAIAGWPSWIKGRAPQRLIDGPASALAADRSSLR
jgi:hypothetical protein